MRVRELDGLRGVAILFVLLAHSHFDWFPGGGIVGVHMFFVLSGFLITGILLRRGLTWHFYKRRAVRLFPALALVLATYLALAPALGWELWEAAAVAGYVANWADTYQLHYLWSLAVEEQFYVVWPLLLVGLARIGKRFALAATITLLAGLHIERAYGYATGWDWNRIYDGTDTVAVSLLAGCLLAQLRDLGWRVRPRRAAVVAFGLLVAGVLTLTQHTDEGQAFLAYGGLTGIALAGAIVIAAPPAFLRDRLLVRLGTISYGLYLWHLLLINVGYELWRDVEPIAFALLAVPVAWASWRWLEEPLLRRHQLTKNIAPSSERRVGTSDEGLPVKQVPSLATSR